MEKRYSMFIQWSEEDQAYLVLLPEWEDRLFSGVVTHGNTYEEAARNGEEALRALIAATVQAHEPLPDPDTRTVRDTIPA